jgi:hypothetical protein
MSRKKEQMCENGNFSATIRGGGGRGKLKIKYCK